MNDLKRAPGGPAVVERFHEVCLTATPLITIRRQPPLIRRSHQRRCLVLDARPPAWAQNGRLDGNLHPRCLLPRFSDSRYAKSTTLCPSCKHGFVSIIEMEAGIARGRGVPEWGFRVRARGGRPCSWRGQRGPSRVGRHAAERSAVPPMTSI